MPRLPSGLVGIGIVAAVGGLGGWLVWVIDCTADLLLTYVQKNYGFIMYTNYGFIIYTHKSG